MSPMLEFFIGFVLLVYVILKIYKTNKSGNKSKRDGLIYTCVFFLIAMLHRYPFNVSIYISFSIMSFFCSLVMLRNLLSKGIDSSFYVFFIAFLGFGVVFLVQDMRENGWGLFPKSHLAGESNSQKKPTAARRTKNPDGGLRRSDHPIRSADASKVEDGKEVTFLSDAKLNKLRQVP